MKIYFSIASIPELRDLPRGDRRVAWYTCRGKVSRTRTTWLGTFVGFVVGGALGAGILWIALDRFAHRGLPPLFLGGFACGVITIGVTDYVRSLAISSQIGPHLAELLEARKAKAKARVELNYARGPFEEEDLSPRHDTGTADRSA